MRGAAAAAPLRRRLPLRCGVARRGCPLMRVLPGGALAGSGSGGRGGPDAARGLPQAAGKGGRRRLAAGSSPRRHAGGGRRAAGGRRPRRAGAARRAARAPRPVCPRAGVRRVLAPGLWRALRCAPPFAALTRRSPSVLPSAEAWPRMGAAYDRLQPRGCEPLARKSSNGNEGCSVRLFLGMHLVRTVLLLLSGVSVPRTRGCVLAFAHVRAKEVMLNGAREDTIPALLSSGMVRAGYVCENSSYRMCRRCASNSIPQQTSAERRVHGSRDFLWHARGACWPLVLCPGVRGAINCNRV